MGSDSPHRLSYRLALLDLLACAAGLVFVSWLFGLLAGPDFWSARGILRLSIAAATCWFAIRFPDPGRTAGFGTWIEQFVYAAGLTLLAQAALDYVLYIPPIPLWVVFGGAGVSIGLIASLRRWVYPAPIDGPSGILLVGFDSVARALAPYLQRRIVGVVDGDPARVPPELPFLGDPARLAEVVAAKRPGRIIVDARNGSSQASLKTLLDLRYSGIAIDQAPAVYERMLCRVCWNHLQPLDLLLSPSMSANRPIMAVQAVYTNLIGLALLLALLPVLVVLWVLVALFSGGAALERIECLGFQGIPFYLLRFRTRRPDGEPTRIGRAVSALRLANLPQLFNVVRGEMALFGPPPVRRAFAGRLSQVIPIYLHRFTVKPGILGWSQANLRGPAMAADEMLRLEYDLYYVKQGSPIFDLEIFFRTVFRVPFSPGHAPELRRTPGVS